MTDCVLYFHSSQNGGLGDADIERLKLTDGYINGTQVGVCVCVLYTNPIFINLPSRAAP